MTRTFFFTALAVVTLVAAIPSHSVQAQVLSIGRGGVQYNGYGRGYYGGYGQGYGAGPRVYSGYGNGPYGYGGGYGYGYGNGTYNNGYGSPGIYVQPNRNFYRPFGGQVYSNYGYNW